MNPPFINIDIIDKRILQFESIHTPSFLKVSTDSSAIIAFGHDIETTAPDEWLVHIDTILKVPDAAKIHVRVSYSLTTRFENIWATGVASEYLQNSLQITHEAFNTQCKAAGIDCEIGESFATQARTMEVWDHFFTDIKEAGLYAGENKEMYKRSFLNIEFGGNTALLCSGTVVIMDQLFFDNKIFDRDQHIHSFGKYIPFRHYITIKLKLVKLLQEKKAVHFNMKQAILFIQMIKCACTLLLSNHVDTMKEDLESKGLTEELYNAYIKEASSFLNMMKGHFKAHGATFTNLEEDIDWAALIR